MKYLTGSLLAVFLAVWIQSIAVLANRQIYWYDCSSQRNGNYYHPHNCSQFITCDNGRAWEKSCPSGNLVFNQTRNQCLWPGQTRCLSCWEVDRKYCNGGGGSGGGSGGGWGGGSGGGNGGGWGGGSGGGWGGGSGGGNGGGSDWRQIYWYDCSNQRNGDYYHPHNCTHFITCENGRVWERPCPPCHYDPRTCPSGYLIFNQTRNECLRADRTRCQNCWEVNRKYCNGGGGGGWRPGSATSVVQNHAMILLLAFTPLLLPRVRLWNKK